MNHNIDIIHLTSENHSTEHPAVLSGIMRSAWQSAFQGILSDAVIQRYTQPEFCSAMFSEILASGEGNMYLASRDQLPMGLLYWLPETDSTVRIEALLTIPEAWGKGVGPALMESAFTDIADAGYKNVRVMPFAENHRAQRFYQKFGFTATGNTHQGDVLELEYICRIQ